MKILKKRILAYTLALAIILSSLVFGVSTVSAETTPDYDVWDGDTATGFANPDAAGTEADPYIIETAEQLRYLLENYTKTDASKGKFFKITKDIYLNDISNVDDPVDLWGKQNWLAGYGETVPVPANNVNLFEGTLDGDGHTIYGLYVNGVAFAGLFPAVSSYATIKNLSLEKVFITGGSGSAGAIAGWAEYTAWQSATQITNCSVVDATIGQSANIEFVGGLVGRIDTTSVTVTNCFAYGLTLSQDTGRGIAGGLIGFAQSGGTLKINNSFSVGYFATCSQITKAICTNVYTTADIPEGYTNGGVTKLIEDQMKGENAKVNMALDYRWVYKVQGDSFPTFQDGIIDVWDGTNTIESLDAFEGHGTAEDPYQIENGNQLAYVVATNLEDGLCFKLTKDIRLNDTSTANWKDTAKNWVWADVRFVGTFDGDGHTIDGLFYNKASSTEYRVGLFLYVGANGGHSCTIKNFKMTNAYIANNSTTSDAAAGVIAGQASQVTTFENIYIDETCEVNSPAADSAGGLLGKTDYNINITNCATHAKVTGETYIGAFVGRMKSNGRPTIIKSYTTTDAPVTGNLNTDKNFLGTASADVYAIKKQGTVDAVVTELTLDKMKGENAKTYMPGLSYRFYWEITDGYPVVNVRDGDLWDGTYGTSYEIFNNNGDGSKENPYLIENGAQLAFAVSYNRTLNDGSYYKLVKDIILNDTEVTNWEATAKPWIWNNHLRFNGTLDGDGHTIEGLYMSTDSVNGRCALIAYIGKDSSKDPNKVAEVKNITFKSASINSTATATDSKLQGYAVVAGQTSGETLFENLYIDENSSVNGPYVTGVAGIIGRGYDNNKGGIATIRNCAVLATINGGSLPGAFVGTYYATDAHITVENSYADTNVGLIGKATTKTITNTYTTVLGSADTGATQLDAANMKSENAKTNMLGLDFYGLWKTTDSYPVLRDMNDRMESWDGTKADSFADGVGTIDDPYQIANGAQLYKMVAEYSNADVTVAPETQTYFRITADINLGGKQWYTITPKVWLDKPDYNTIGFNGVVYGEGHKVYNLCNNVAAGAVGLIPVVTQGAEIHDLHIVGGKLPRANYQTYAVGGLVGMAKATERSKPVFIEGCSVTDITIAAVNGAGGLVGYDYSQSIIIKDSYVSDAAISVTATSSANPGAFIGYIDGSEVGNSFVIENSYCVAENPTVLCRNAALEEALSFNNVYTTNEAYDGSVEGLTKLDDAQMKAKLAGFNYNQVWQTTDNGYSVHLDYAVQKEIFSGTEAAAFAGGKGTEDDPFLISNADQLYKLANATREETLGKFYKLTNDITISRVYDGWTNDNLYTWAVKKAYLEGFTYASSFAGTLDGAGYTVSGIYYNNEITDGGDYAFGMIPFATANAVVKDITVSDINATVTGNGAAVGGVVGAAHVTSDDAENPLNFIQFVGVNVKNCSANAAYTGDIVGRATHGIKFEICNADSIIGNYIDNIFMNGCNEALTLGDNVVIYNALNADSTALGVIRAKLTGANDAYVTDINAVDGFNIADLVSAQLNIDAAAEDEYELVWSQDFNNNTMDYSVWSKNTTMSRKTNLVYGDNATVTGGALKLNNKDTGEVDESGNKIYSVSYGLSTVDTMSFKYGRLEMKAKIPFGAGAFPSLWLTSRNALGNGVSPYGYDNEIDIFEVFGKSTSQNRMVTCMHKWYVDEAGVRTGDECSSGTGWLDGNNSKIDEVDRSHEVTEAGKTAWHTIVFEWTEDTMTFTVDGESFDIKLSEIEDFDLSGYNTDSEGLFNQFMYLRLNNHMYTVGGSSYVYGGIESDIDPSKLTYEIDYIKLYQKDNGEINLK